MSSLYVFSKQIVREDTGNNGKLAITDGRLQLRSFTLSYANTGYFKVLVTPEYRITNERIFPGRVLGHGDNILGNTPDSLKESERGEHMETVLGNLEDALIDLENMECTLEEATY